MSNKQTIVAAQTSDYSLAQCMSVCYLSAHQFVSLMREAKTCRRIITCARCHIKLCQQLGDKTAFLDIDKVHLQYHLRFKSGPRGIVYCSGWSVSSYVALCTSASGYKATKQIQAQYLAIIPALLYMKPELQISRNKYNSEWHTYNSEDCLVSLSIILLYSVVTHLHPCLV